MSSSVSKYFDIFLRGRGSTSGKKRDDATIFGGVRDRVVLKKSADEPGHPPLTFSSAESCSIGKCIIYLLAFARMRIPRIFFLQDREHSSNSLNGGKIIRLRIVNGCSFPFLSFLFSLFSYK